MLQWFVSKKVATDAVTGNGLIDERALNVIQRRFHVQCWMTDTLCIDHLKHYFDSDGWAAVQEVVSVKS